MWFAFLGLTVAALWVNLAGAGLAANRVLRDYPVSRVVGPLLFCLLCLSAEQFHGLGPRPVLLPLSTAFSVIFIWRDWRVLRENARWEALFAAGFVWAFAWRYTFPDITPSGDGMPTLALIAGAMRGEALPAPDLWLYPLRSSVTSGLPPYGAGLLGRLLGLEPGFAFHLSASTVAGMVALLAGACARRLCGWTPGRWALVLCLLVGGSGAVFARGLIPREVPMEPLARMLGDGGYGPALWGILVLFLALVLMAAEEAGPDGPGRGARDALLGATVPLALLADAWTFPLQAVLIGAWFAYRASRGDLASWRSAAAGACLAAALTFPLLFDFSRAAFPGHVDFQWTTPLERAEGLGWWATFWPAAGMLALALLGRDRRPFDWFLVSAWALLLAATEFVCNPAGLAGTDARITSTRAWWPWVYAGVVLTAGAANLGSGSRLRRMGTLALLLPTLLFFCGLVRQYAAAPKPAVGRLSGSHWIDSDPAIREIMGDLAHGPAGVVLESGLSSGHTDAPAVTLFAGRQSLVGWPSEEALWRGPQSGGDTRADDIERFYTGGMKDPLGWLRRSDVRYVLWLARDNVPGRVQFADLRRKLGSAYFWHPVYEAKPDFEVGFFEAQSGAR
jgi:hypothetical protein